MNRCLVVNPEVCTGCNSCMLTCSFTHEGYFSFSKSRMQIEKDEERAVSIPRVCIQCKDAPCIQVCSEEALFKDKGTGAIMVDKDKCTGCKKCVKACPYGGIVFDEEGSIPLICDLCGGKPSCIEVCRFPQAIKFKLKKENDEK